MLFIAASSSCRDESAHHLHCGWQNGSVCRALEEGEWGEEKKEGGGGLFPPSRLERDAKASPRGRWGRRWPRGCLLSPASPSRLLPAGPLLPLFLVFLLSLPVSLRVCYPSLSFSELSLPLSLVFLQHTHTHIHTPLSRIPKRETLGALLLISQPPKGRRPQAGAQGARAFQPALPSNLDLHSNPSGFAHISWANFFL